MALHFGAVKPEPQRQRGNPISTSPEIFSLSTLTLVVLLAAFLVALAETSYLVRAGAAAKWLRPGMYGLVTLGVEILGSAYAHQTTFIHEAPILVLAGVFAGPAGAFAAIAASAGWHLVEAEPLVGILGPEIIFAAMGLAMRLFCKEQIEECRLSIWLICGAGTAVASLVWFQLPGLTGAPAATPGVIAGTVVLHGISTTLAGIIVTLHLGRTRTLHGLKNSEAQLRSVLDAAPWVIALKDRDGKTVLANRRYGETFGISRDDVAGKSVEDIFPPEQAELYRAHEREVLETGQAIDREFPNDTVQGERILLETKFPIRNATGAITGIGFIGTDITERRRAEEKRREANELLTAVLDSSTEATVAIDNENRVITWKGAAEKIYGWTEDEVLGRPLPTIPEDLKDEALETFRTLCRTGERMTVETRRLRKDGATIDMRISLAPLRDPSGRVIGTLGVGTDITRILESRGALEASEARYRALVETALVVPWELDLDTWLFTYVGPQAEAFLGCPLEDWLGEDFWVDHLHPDDRDEAVEFCVSSSEKGLDHDFEYRMLRADGSEIWVRDLVTVVKENGKPVGLRGVLIDITERRQAEQAMRASEQRLRAIHDNVIVGIVMIDEQGIIQTFNAAAKRIFGFAPEEAIGQNVRILISGNAAEEHDNRLRRYRETGKQSIIGDRREVEGQRKDGSVFPLELAVEELEMPDARYFTAVLRDITEAKQAENELVSAKERAELANRAKTAFLANMSHELRTPLNAVIGFSEIVRNETFGPLGNERYAQYMKHIHDAGHYLLGIISDILDMSKLESGRMEINEEILPVHQVTNAALTLVRDRATEAGIGLETDLAEDLPRLRGDGRLIRQVLVNLLSNSLKFTPRDGTIAISASMREDGGLEIVVRDNGKGIPSDRLEAIFEPFSQADSTISREHGGTGLGLSISRSIMEQHDGEIAVESVLGESTVVTLIFPAGRTLPADTGESLDPPESRAAQA